MSVASIAMAVYETRKNQKNLNNMSMYSCDITVHRNYTQKEIDFLVKEGKKEIKK